MYLAPYWDLVYTSDTLTDMDSDNNNINIINLDHGQLDNKIERPHTQYSIVIRLIDKV